MIRADDPSTVQDENTHQGNQLPFDTYKRLNSSRQFVRERKLRQHQSDPQLARHGQGDPRQSDQKAADRSTMSYLRTWFGCRVIFTLYCFITDVADSHRANGANTSS